MYVRRNIRLNLIAKFAWKNILLFILWSAAVTWLYHVADHNGYDLGIPFLPLSTIGIAVAFYIGFKNNASYDRFWEGRKIWGGIVNYSRSWAMNVLTLVKDGEEVKRALIYRHIAWINALRVQLRQPNSFSLKESRSVEALFEKHGERNPVCAGLDKFISSEEVNDLNDRKNVATHLIKNQAIQINKLLSEEKLTEFDKTIFHSNLEEFYNLQGKCERIKNTPFPRQYAYFSQVFTWIFIFLLPFGLLDVFEGQMIEGRNLDIYEWLLFLMIPFSVLISWIFATMEAVGNSSEDPFEGRVNDVPMTALCRTIEIDLRDMLDEKELPEKVQPKDNILY